MTDTPRDAALRQMLTENQLQLEEALRAQLRDGRTDPRSAGRDEMEQSDDNVRGDLRFALLQMKSEALAHLRAALERLDQGHYGNCVTCERPIPSLRLRAMPFAVRCQPCAAQRERSPAANAVPSRWGLLADVAVAGPE
jgi:DnaK suppressor protein